MIKSDKALAALSEQFAHCKEQGQYPNLFWDLMKAFGSDINAGKYNGADESVLRAALSELEKEILRAR